MVTALVNLYTGTLKCMCNPYILQKWEPVELVLRIAPIFCHWSTAHFDYQWSKLIQPKLLFYKGNIVLQTGNLSLLNKVKNLQEW